MVLVVADTFLVSINAESGGQAVTNVIGVRKPGASPADVTAAVLAAWKIGSGPLSRMANTYQMKNITAMYLGTADGAVHSLGDASTGLNIQSKSTNAACALVSYGGASRARSSKGRMYFGPITEDFINTDGRTLQASSRTAIEGAFNFFRGSLTGAGFEWVVVSRKLQIATPILAVSVQPIIATQRRRIR